MAGIGVGAWLGTIMLFNVWALIWPNQQKILGLKPATDEEKSKARRVAFLASRANVDAFDPAAVLHGGGLVASANFRPVAFADRVATPRGRPTTGPAIAGRNSRASSLRRRCRDSVPVELLNALAPLLRFERQRRGRTREQARNADRLAGFLAVAVAAVVDHA